jgi:hypothetical protein
MWRVKMRETYQNVIKISGELLHICSLTQPVEAMLLKKKKVSMRRRK